jgi:hypothetical protein
MQSFCKKSTLSIALLIGFFDTLALQRFTTDQNIKSNDQNLIKI